jgi:uncharacterized protein (TIGR02453 family)
VNAAMIEFAPDHVRPPAKTMMRIYRDTRFSPDKRPYKRHVSAWFGRRGDVRTTGPGFYLQVAPAEVLLGMGIYMPPSESMLAIRRWMSDNHQHYAKLIKAATRIGKTEPPLEQIAPQPLSRMPKGFPPEHPAGELLRARHWGVQLKLPGEMAIQPEFNQLVIRRFQAAAPIVLALDEAVDSGAPKAAKNALKAMF